jgi:hypothetical protein
MLAEARLLSAGSVPGVSAGRVKVLQDRKTSRDAETDNTVTLA